MAGEDKRTPKRSKGRRYGPGGRHGDWQAMHEMAQMPIRPKADYHDVPIGMVSGAIMYGKQQTPESKKAQADWDARMKKIQEDKEKRQAADRKREEQRAKQAEIQRATSRPAEPIAPKGSQPAPSPVSGGTSQTPGAQAAPGTPAPVPARKTAVEQAIDAYNAKNSQAPTLGFRRKQGKLQNDMTTVNGMGLDMSRSGERAIRDNAAKMIRTQQGWAYEDAVEERQRSKEAARMARINAALQRGQQMRDDRNYENRRFSSQHGWDNLGRMREGDAKAIQGYGRDHDQYKQSWGQLEARMRQLGEYYGKAGGVGLGGKGKEFAQVRDLIQKTHENGGLSQAQMEAALDKMDSYRKGILDTADAGAAATKRAAAQEAARNRQSLGILAEGLSDEDVAKRIAGNRHAKVGEVLSALAKSKLSAKQGDGDTAGGVEGAEEYNKHLGTLLDNGYSMADMYRAAMRDKDASGEYRKYAEGALKGVDLNTPEGREKQASVQEAVGLQYLQQVYDANKGDLSGLDTAIKGINTVGGGPNENAHEALRKWNEPAPAAPAVPPAAQPPAPAAPQPIAPKDQPPAPTAAPAPIEPAPAGPAAPVTTPAPEPPAPAEQKKPGLAILTR